jgi:hypothetical protein
MRSRAVAAVALAMLAAGGLAACGGAKGSSPGPGTQGTQLPAGNGPAMQCGTVRTAAGVPVEIEVQRGTAGCGAALAVERAYSRAIASGKVRGNGGGAPVTIKGWVCQGYNTPRVLATGRASACHKNGTEILAILPTPTASPPSS